MGAHLILRPSGHRFELEGAETILGAGLRAGLALPYGCSGGNCGACRARLLSGEIHNLRPADFHFNAAEKAAGYFLMCCHGASGEVELEAQETSDAAEIPLQKILATVKRIAYPHPDLLRLEVQTPRTQHLRFLAGQYVELRLPGGERGESFIASCPCDGRNLQFHIARLDDAFSRAAFANLRPRQKIHLKGPAGDFVLHDESARPLIFLAYAQGFAPVKSLLEHAIALDNAAWLHFYWLAPPDGHYARNLCRSWVDALDNFQYSELQEGESNLTRMVKQMMADHPDFGQADFYIAGPANFLSEAQTLLHALGVTQARLHIGGRRAFVNRIKSEA